LIPSLEHESVEITEGDDELEDIEQKRRVSQLSLYLFCGNSGSWHLNLKISGLRL